jgi:hypothetical protein
MKTWTHLKGNEKAVATGYPMFYIDAVGETVPASDSDDEYNDFYKNCRVCAPQC